MRKSVGPAVMLQVAVASGWQAVVQGQSGASARGAAYSAPRTPWGAADIQGAYTNSDESQTPLEHPDPLAGSVARAEEEAAAASRGR